jgi:peptidoglycan/LPS O-acetylase OafA/YrhL
MVWLCKENYAFSVFQRDMLKANPPRRWELHGKMIVPKWPSRLYALDVSRGMAALSVVLWHWQHFAYEGNVLSKDFVRENQPFYGMLKLFYENGAMGVDYFFLLSGFIFFWLYRNAISQKIIGWKTFFVQRFSRLYPLHAATLAIVATLQIFFTHRSGNAFVYPFNDTYHFFLNLAFASNWGIEKGWSFNAPVWSVSIEILLYAVFFLIAVCGKGGVLCTFLVSVISFTAQFISSHLIFKGLAPFFFGGTVFYITYIISIKYSEWKRPIYLLTVYFWLFTVLSFYFSEVADIITMQVFARRVFLIGFPIYLLFPLSICSLALLEIDKKISFKQFSWIGDITYSTYLLHFPLQLSFMLAASYGVISFSFYYCPMSLILFFSILVSTSYLTYRSFEAPMQKFIRDFFTIH